MKLSGENSCADKLHINTILTLAFVFFFISSSAQTNIDQLKKSILNPSKINLPDTLYKISNYYIKEENSDSIFKYAQLGLNLAKITEDKFNIARFKYSLSIAYEIENKNNISLAFILDSKKYFETDLLHASYLASIYKQLGNLYKNFSKYDIALEYYQKGLIISKKLNDSINIASVYNNIGTLYFEINEKDILALNYFNYALEILSKLKKQNHVVRTLNNIAVYYLKRVQILISPMGFI
jgi:tetratricopeptide (TPR) repeat protein